MVIAPEGFFDDKKKQIIKMTQKDNAIIEKVLPKSIPDLLYPENSDCPTGMFCNFIHRTDVIDIIQKALSLQDKNLRQTLKELKEEWRAKCRRMEIMSGEVAIYELEQLLLSKFGEEFKEMGCSLLQFQLWKNKVRA